MNRNTTIRIAKYTVYALLLLFLYVLQTVPGLFALFGAKPIWVIPAAIAIAMYEGELTGGIYGAVAGLFCDMGGFALFGFNGFIGCLCCAVAGYLVLTLMRCNVWGCLLFTSLTLLIARSIEFLFSYGIWGYENAWKIYVFDMLPVVAYSTAITPLAYWMVKRLHFKFKHLLREQ